MTVHILFGSETGNAEQLAEHAQEHLQSLGHEVTIDPLDDAKVADLPQLGGVLLIITSTWGDGEPPSNAAELHYQLSKTKESLSGVRYAVFAIGMASFEHFCQAGKDFDDFLARSGAKRVLPLTLSDDNYDEDLPIWLNRLESVLQA